MANSAAGEVFTPQPTGKSRATMRATGIPLATDAPIFRSEPSSGTLYVFHSDSFDDSSAAGTLPVAKLGALYLPPSDTRFEFTLNTSGYASARMLNLSEGCFPDSGKDEIVLPFGRSNPTVYRLVKGHGCSFSVEIEWFDSTWSFWITNESMLPERLTESQVSNSATNSQPDFQGSFSITQVSPQFTIMAGGQVNLRSGPGTQYEKVGSILGGNTLEVVGITNGESIQGMNEWYLVSFQGGAAYIAKALTVRNS